MISGFFNIIANVILFTGYIVGNNSFPVPLTSSEEKEYINRFKSGDLNAKNILIERNLRLVVHIAKKFSSIKEVEDLISVGTIGLIKGIESFDYTKGTKLATYASRCIENEILMYLRRTNKVKGEISFYEPLNTDWDGNELLLSDILGSDENNVFEFIEEEVDKTLLVIAMDSLNNREHEIISLRFGLNGCLEKTQKEVADLLGISQSYISRLEKRIIKKLKKEINKML